MILTGREFAFESFEGQDLHKENLSCSTFINCSFVDCNLEDANCSHSKFLSCDFTGTILRYTNFARSALTDSKFYPKDAYGVIFSLECKTFKGLRISKLWWFGYKYFSLIMEPEKDGGKDPRDADIGAMGSDRYVKLCTMFERRGV